MTFWVRSVCGSFAVLSVPQCYISNASTFARSHEGQSPCGTASTSQWIISRKVSLPPILATKRVAAFGPKQASWLGPNGNCPRSPDCSDEVAEAAAPG